ncbi:MAG: Oxygen-independent coproporphyrinogen III oxidase [Candidatus Marinimicrobia bacterium]|nr:Oxygen-independent coproporphyrinogen III oxidase [Candidatus Neomarinimicrobiota bacterium]
MSVNQEVIVDIDLLKKYDKPGPRYTSYPTAPHFHEGFDDKSWEEELQKSNANESAPDLSLYFHFPFCDTLCLYCGCNVIITRTPAKIDEYIEYLKKEIDMLASYLPKNRTRKVRQFQWGGGTPTYLTADQIRDIMGYIREQFEFSDGIEAGVETDPRELTYDRLQALREMGFNRASMGVQDFDPLVQKTVNRIQPEEMTRRHFNSLRELGYQSLNIDLIYGLPHQTPERFERTVDSIIDISPERIALFNYAHVPWLKPHQNYFKEEWLPTAETKLRIIKMAIDKFTDAGYVFIGMDHFAKPDDELTLAQQERKLYRNFQGYSPRAGLDLYALGMTSISQTQDVYAQNVKEITTYYQRISEGRLPVFKGYELNREDQIRRWVITRLMCDFELHPSEVEEAFDIDFNDYFAEDLPGLEPFIDDDLVVYQGDVIKVNPLGRLLIRNIAMSFDSYLKREKKEETPTYSRTV